MTLIKSGLFAGSILFTLFPQFAIATTDTKVTQVLSSKIDINRAEAVEISKAVRGLGIKRAQAIVAYRTKHGAFTTPLDLAKVAGISEMFVRSKQDQLLAAFRFVVGHND